MTARIANEQIRAAVLDRARTPDLRLLPAPAARETVAVIVDRLRLALAAMPDRPIRTPDGPSSAYLRALADLAAMPGDSEHVGDVQALEVRDVRTDTGLTVPCVYGDTPVMLSVRTAGAAVSVWVPARDLLDLVELHGTPVSVSEPRQIAEH